MSRYRYGYRYMCRYSSVTIEEVSSRYRSGEYSSCRGEGTAGIEGDAGVLREV